MPLYLSPERARQLGLKRGDKCTLLEIILLCDEADHSSRRLICKIENVQDRTGRS